jgi:hypothetical protein
MNARYSTGRRLWRAAAAAALGITAAFAAYADGDGAFLPKLINSSTVPANGDTNPYGVAFVPEGFPSGGAIKAGDVLASNFNGSSGFQGTGLTIIQFDPRGVIAPPGTATVFFTSALPGLSTALGVLRGGYVVVGNVPTTDGTFNTIGQGALQIIDRHGNLVGNPLTDPVFLDGPWDLTIDDHGGHAQIYVSCVINGTVTRLDVTVTSKGVTVNGMTTVAKGYPVMANAAAVVTGPTGLAIDTRTDTLYVASTTNSKIYSVSNASHRSIPAIRGTLVTGDKHLIGPLALRLAPNGNLLTANGDATPNNDPLNPSQILEFTKNGRFVRLYDVDTTQGGAFGLDTVIESDGGFNYAFIDDVTNNLTVERLPTQSHQDQD